MLTLSLHMSLYCRHQLQSRSLKLVQFNGGHCHAKHDYTELHVLTWGIKTTSPPMTLTISLSPILAPHYFASTPLWLQVKESQLFSFFLFWLIVIGPQDKMATPNYFVTGGHPKLFCRRWTPQNYSVTGGHPKLLCHRWPP